MSQILLPKTIVGLDIETTSLDPNQGEIIEVAAIRFGLKSSQEISRFEALCKPSQPLTSETTGLTGITADMLLGKPGFEEVRDSLKEYIGSDTVLAHNATFDISWLTAHGCPLDNPIWDTFPLAATAWPEAESYNLGSLAASLGITLRGEHRAAADILLTWQLLLKIRQALQVSAKNWESVRALLHSSGQDRYLPLFVLADVKPRKKSIKAKAASPSNIDNLAIGDILGSGGILEKNLPSFTARADQLALAESIGESLVKKSSQLIEAGPGIGKTFAYLVAGLTGKGRVLISTHTRVLQDQLGEKDIPALWEALKIKKSVAMLKGRQNYVCKTALKKIMSKRRLPPAEAWLALKLLLWLESGGGGDIERLNLSHQGTSILWGLTADSSTCRLSCEARDCPYTVAREKAVSADITVINHALLLRWGLGEESLSDGYNLLIVDEAHQLESAALQASESDLSRTHLEETLHTLRQLLTDEKILHEVDSLIREFHNLESQAFHLLEIHSPEGSLRLSKALRRSQNWQKLQSAMGEWLARLSFALGLLRAQEATIKASLTPIYREAMRNLETFRIEFEQVSEGKSQDRFQWLERHILSQEASFHDAALAIHPYLQESLNAIQPTILISGTLTAEDKFTYIQNRFGLSGWEQRQFPSPFNFQDNMHVFVVDDGPYPSGEDFDQFVAELIGKVGAKTHGRLLGLFTSQKSLSNVHRKLVRHINKDTIRLFSQKMSGGRHNIAKRFRDDHASILLGTSSFWEGFDSPGETLSVLVIPKLPFPAPNDPLIDALSEQAGEREAFGEVMLPRMILRLKQGVGRLIRSSTDTGVLILLDRRLVEKQYGREALHSLPSAPVEVVSRHEVAEKVADWFGEETITRWHTS